MNNLAYETKTQTSCQVITFNLSCAVSPDSEIGIGSWRLRNAVRVTPEATQPICRFVLPTSLSCFRFSAGPWKAVEVKVGEKGGTHVS